MERNYESEKKREPDYLLDFEDMLTKSASMVKRGGSGEVLITLRYGDPKSHIESLDPKFILLFLSFIPGSRAILVSKWPRKATYCSY